MKRSIIFSFVLSFTLIMMGCTQKDKMNMSQDHNGHQNMNGNKSQIHTSWTLSSPNPTVNQLESFTINIRDNNNKPIQDFEISHEKKMHLIVVSEDLSYFNHIHPRYIGGGKFTISTRFPKGGKYKLIADFVPKGGMKTIQTYWLSVKGKQIRVPLQPEQNFVKEVDGKEITLSFNRTLEKNRESMLDFLIKDSNTKEPITDLQPYLGAIGHVVILSSDTKEYLHVHPMDENTSGPYAKFHTTFPKSGVYKIWGQFQENGKVFTIPYVVKVS